MSQAWITHDLLVQIQWEAESKAPLETGGLLFGYCSEKNQVVVTDMVGPGPKAIHRKWTFRPDYDFHREESVRIYNESAGIITYLGDWHSHPSDAAYMSFLDKRALRNIARFKSNYIDCPIMLILGRNSRKNSTEWAAGVWRITLKSHKFPRTDWDFTPLEITLYDGFN